MKKLILLIFVLVWAFQAKSQTCLEHFQDLKMEKTFVTRQLEADANSTAFLGVSLNMTLMISSKVIAGSALTGLVVGVAAAAIVPVVGVIHKKVYNKNLKKMISLINESEAYLKEGTSGKWIRKLHRKLKRKVSGITLKEVATAVYEANLNGSLCEDNKTRFRHVKDIIVL